MRKLAATLAIVALLFSVGSAWADSNDDWDAFSQGWAAYERGDYSAAINIWRPLAERGFGDAQFLLGSMYKVGWGVPIDNIQAYM